MRQRELGDALVTRSHAECRELHAQGVRSRPAPGLSYVFSPKVAIEALLGSTAMGPELGSASNSRANNLIGTGSEGWCASSRPHAFAEVSKAKLKTLRSSAQAHVSASSIGWRHTHHKQSSRKFFSRSLQCAFVPLFLHEVPRPQNQVMLKGG